MGNKIKIINNEKGSAIVMALIFLSILTIIGISSSVTSTIELQIVRNERIYQRDFYIADSAWKYAAYWLEANAKAPSKVNPSLTGDSGEIVRNFGDAPADDLNDNFADGTEDGNTDLIPFWYNVQYKNKSTVPGSGKDYKKFGYIIKSNANKKQEIQVGVSKIYKVGY